MTRLTTLDLQPFYRNSVGIDRIFDSMLNRIEHSSSTTNYPPYNIIKIDDDNYKIEVAVAGFTKGEIDVQTHDGQLIIKGEKEDQEVLNVNYLHSGIGNRKFLRTFELSDYVEVASAEVKDGILTVDLERHVPESMKPKTIDINYKS
jgi:molecular chaperone IbpA